MLSVHDDLPIHQTPATLDQPASSDPAAYERYYFGFFDVDGSAAVGLTVTLHPNKGLIDAALTVLVDGRHESLMASDQLGADRSDLVCGPIRLTLTEPMRTLRIRVEGDSDFAADMTFCATTPAIEEARVTRTRSNRVVQDRSRYVQLGLVRGFIDSPLGDIVMTEGRWHGGRDHSWGIWDAPKAHASETKHASPSFFWLIGAFDDWAVQAVTHQNADGEVYGEYAAVCPSLASGADLAGPGARQQSRPMTGLTITFPEDGWHFTHAVVSIGAAAGPDEHLRIESLHTMLPRAIGYSHPTWISGTVHPTLPHVERDAWDLSSEDLLERHNHRALQCVRLTRGDGSVGYGITDQSVSIAQAAEASTRSFTQPTHAE